MGTPEFAVPSLEQLVASGFPPVAVVTAPDRRKGRGRRRSPSPVKAAAEALGVSVVLQPESVKDPTFAEQIGALNPDIIVVVAFRILPAAVYQHARLGAFNLHGSLLPRYRGAAPIHHAVMSGDHETGVTTFFLKQKVDTGHVILQDTLAIGPDETTGDVYDRMKHLGARVVVETVRAIASGSVTEYPQDDAAATPAPKVFADNGCVDWSGAAPEVHNFIRGYSPAPGAWTMHGDSRLKLLRSAIYARDSETAPHSLHISDPGTVLRCDDRLVVACAEGAVELTELQRQGGRAMDAATFLRGYEITVGDRFECVPEGDRSKSANAS